MVVLANVSNATGLCRGIFLNIRSILNSRKGAKTQRSVFPLRLSALRETLLSISPELEKFFG